MTTTLLFSIIPVSGMISQKSKPSAAPRAANQHDLHTEPSILTESIDHSDSGTLYGGIDMAADDFYRVYTTNFKKPPQVGSLIPRKPSGHSGGPK